MTSSVGTVKKGWGSEYIFASEPEYCGKLLRFNSGAQFSMHFHKDKKETWYCLSGKFMIDIIDTSNATIYRRPFIAGDMHTNQTLVPHRIICEEAGTIIEVSMEDSPEDNYRVMPGDSQHEVHS